MANGNGIFSGMAKAPGLFLGGFNDPNLSDQANEQARKKAMLMAGLQGMMASRSAPGMPAPGTLQILAQMGMTGQQAGQQFRQQAGQQQALQNPALTQGLNEQQMAALQALPPGARAQLLAKQAFTPPPAPEFKVVDGNLVRTGADGSATVVYSAPPDPRISAELQDFLATEYGVLDANTLSPSELRNAQAEFYQRRLQEGQAQGGIDPFEKTLSGLAGTVHERLVDDYVNSIDTLESIGAVKSMLADSRTPTGAADSLTFGLRNLMADFGLVSPEEAKDIGLQTAFRAITNKLTLGEAEKLTGPKSDKDIEFLMNSVPQLRNTELGNMLIALTVERIARRRQELAMEMDRYGRQYGSEGYMEHLNDWTRANQIDLTDIRARAEATLQAQERATTGGNAFGDLVPEGGGG